MHSSVVHEKWRLIFVTGTKWLPEGNKLEIIVADMQLLSLLHCYMEMILASFVMNLKSSAIISRNAWEKKNWRHFRSAPFAFAKTTHWRNDCYPCLLQLQKTREFSKWQQCYQLDDAMLCQDIPDDTKEIDFPWSCKSCTERMFKWNPLSTYFNRTALRLISSNSFFNLDNASVFTWEKSVLR